jgi:hypothetical protein
MKPKRTRLRTRLALAAGSTALALLAAELTLQRVFPIGALLAQPDEELLFRSLPHGANVCVLPDGTWVVTRLNSLGHRGPEHGPKRDGQLRVAVYGDSMIQSTETLLEHTFPVRLEHELALLDCSVETLNAGTSGYGPDQTLLLFEAELERVQPDLVVLAICVQNDARDVMRNKLFELAADGALLRQEPSVPEAVERAYRERERIASWPVLVRLFLFATGRIERPTVTTRLSSEELARLRPRGHGRFNKRSRSLMGAILRRFRDSAREHDVGFALMVIPSSFDVIEGFVPDLDPATVEPYDRRESTDAYAELARAIDVPCLDLFDPMKTHGDRSLFLEGNFHLSPEGQSFAARHVARFLIDQGLVVPRDERAVAPGDDDGDRPTR